MNIDSRLAGLRVLTAALTCTMVAVAAGRADGSPRSRAGTLDGYALAYDLRFAACYEALADAAAADPRDPAPLRAIAAVTWIEILFAQGVATFEAFTGEISKGDVERPPIPPALAARFHRAIEEARTLAEQQMARADGADAHYQVGATAALSALYRSTVEGRTLGAFGQGRRAVREMKHARELAPETPETALILGMSAYTVSTMSWPVRTLARLGGLSGNREEGLKLLKETAASGSETQADALVLLMIADNREGHHTDVLQRLEHLQRLYPRNRLLQLNHAATALAAGQPHHAERVLSQRLTDLSWEAPPLVLGETALWLALRGTAYARLHRSSDAVADLQNGLTAAPRDWVRGRIHAQLGELAVTAGDEVQARQQFEMAVEFSERGGDRSAVEDAKQKLNALRP